MTNVQRKEEGKGVRKWNQIQQEHQWKKQKDEKKKSHRIIIKLMWNIMLMLWVLLYQSIYRVLA